MKKIFLVSVLAVTACGDSGTSVLEKVGLSKKPEEQVVYKKKLPANTRVVRLGSDVSEKARTHIKTITSKAQSITLKEEQIKVPQGTGTVITANNAAAEPLYASIDYGVGVIYVSARTTALSIVAQPLLGIGDPVKIAAALKNKQDEIAAHPKFPELMKQIDALAEQGKSYTKHSPVMILAAQISNDKLSTIN